MLKAIASILFSLPLILLAGNPQSTEAAKYNDAILAQQDHISLSLQQYGDVINKTTDSLFAVKSLDELTERIVRSIDTVKNMEPFYGDDELRQAAISLFSFYEKIARGEYKKILSLLFLPEDMGDTNYEMEQIVNDIAMQEFIQANEFAAVQNTFAAKYGFVLNAKPEAGSEN